MNSGEESFHRAGFPTMALFAGIAFNVLGIFFGLRRSTIHWTGTGSNLGRSFLLINFVNMLFAVFLIFGPGQPLDAQPNTLGFQLFLSTSAGFYAAYSNLKGVTIGTFVLNVYLILAFLGQLSLLSSTVAIWSIGHDACVLYFNTSDDNNRCDDTGYLQLLRTFGLTALFFLCIQAFQLLVTLSEEETTRPATAENAKSPLMHHNYSSDYSGSGSEALAAQQAAYAAPAPAVQPAAQYQGQTM